MCELNDNGEYQVTELKLINNKFGDSIVASLDSKFFVYLPKRATTAIREDLSALLKLNKVIEEEQNLYIGYLGGQYNKFKFFIKEKL